MVDVRVGKDHCVDRLRIEVRETAVHLISMLARTLLEAAIQQDALAINLQQMLRAGGGASGTAKFEFHKGFEFGEADGKHLSQFARMKRQF